MFIIGSNYEPILTILWKSKLLRLQRIKIEIMDKLWLLWTLLTSYGCFLYKVCVVFVAKIIMVFNAHNQYMKYIIHDIQHITHK
jgi:hypothetical protein